jgi:hypothetical protein
MNEIQGAMRCTNQAGQTKGVTPQSSAANAVNSGIDLRSGHAFHAHITYSSQSLHLTLTDKSTMASVSEHFAIDIPGSVGSSTALIGFTASTDTRTAILNILDWTFLTGHSRNETRPTLQKNN